MRTRLLIATALFCAGCSSGDGRGGPQTDDMAGDTTRSNDGAAPAPAAAAVPDRPDAREDTIMIEGMPEIDRVTLVRPPAGVGIPFSTYVPSGMRTEFRTEGAGAVRFSAAFDGAANPAAYMHVQFHAPGAPEPAVSDVAANAAAASAEVRPAEAPSWALDARTFGYRGTDGARITGRAVTAEHHGRYFHVVVHYPEEYSDGMSPRIDRIFRHWRWEDTGEPLIP